MIRVFSSDDRGVPEREIVLRFKTWAGGEEHVEVDVLATSNNFGAAFLDWRASSRLLIYAKLYDSSDVMRLLVTLETLRNEEVFSAEPVIDLVLPYIPYGRQDRVTGTTGQLLNTFVGALNRFDISRIYTLDPHSYETIGRLSDIAIDGVFDYKPLLLRDSELITRVCAGKPDYVLLPDAGAKARGYPHGYTIDQMIVGSKKRDPITGHPTLSLSNDDLKKIIGSNVLIIDDICDGGRTFIEMAKMLRSAETYRGLGLENFPTFPKLYLCVTHGIFSNGLDELLSYFESIGSYHTWPGNPNHPRLQRGTQLL